MLANIPHRPLRPARRSRRRRGLPSLRRRALYHRRLPAGRRRHPRLDLRAHDPDQPPRSRDALAPTQRNRLLKRTEADLSGIEAQVKPIIEAVSDEGDEALARFAREFDKAPVEADAHRRHAGRLRRGREGARARGARGHGLCRRSIRRFHEDQKPEEMWLQRDPPRRLRRRPHPADPLGRLLRPARQGRLPLGRDDDDDPRRWSRACREIAIVTPPGPDGGIDAATLVAARLAGVDRVYKCGGAQGVAAVAYGTDDRAALRQDRRARQPLGGRGQAAARRCHRHRHAGRPERADRPCRRHRRRPPRRPRPPHRSPSMGPTARPSW